MLFLTAVEGGNVCTIGVDRAGDRNISVSQHSIVHSEY